MMLYVFVYVVYVTDIRQYQLYDHCLRIDKSLIMAYA